MSREEEEEASRGGGGFWNTALCLDLWTAGIASGPDGEAPRPPAHPPTLGGSACFVAFQAKCYF